MTTIITNAFTGYFATIYTVGTPTISTIKRHIRRSKASDCCSVTCISIDGDSYEIQDLGRGPQIVAI